MQFIKFTVLVLGLALLAGCATSTSGHKNPDYMNFLADKLAVVIVTSDQERGMTIEQEVLQELRARGIKAKGFTEYVPFNNVQQISGKVISAGYQYALVAGTQSSLSAVFSGTSRTVGAIQPTLGGARYSAVTTADRTYVSDTDVFAYILTADAQTTVWQGEGSRRSRGPVAVFDRDPDSDVLDRLIAEMESDGVIPVK
ncbi:hypothetical protein [Pseudohaliea rubra]|uniref:hypothetical protein n=1 Tax=Pseudohaliea rubra TaxID=475795 RepID=UPI0005573F55|nr:hypothetical protein [Pseudohaliea rubra]